MKRTIKRTAFFALAAMIAGASGVMMTQAQAEESVMNELQGSTTAALSFGSGYTTSFGVAVGYSRTFMDMLQGTFLGVLSTGGGTTFLNLEVGPTFDLAIDNTGIRNAVFLTAAGGIQYMNNGGTTNFAYTVALGKRFALCNVISWNPQFTMSGATVSGSNPQFALVPISLSFLF